MLLALFICPVALTLAYPGSKYPYQYLLDDGNVELDKTNTEQIKLVLPGGSLAIRYPAIGYGAEIVHVKVNAVDFGSNVRAKIIEGGPGFNYVVIILFGQPGIPYDTAVTIYMKKEYNSKNEETNVVDTINESDPYGVENDRNDSAEDISNVLTTHYRNNMNEEMVQKSNTEELNEESSSNVYSYSANVVPYNEKDKDAYNEDNRQKELVGDADGADGIGLYTETDDEDSDDDDDNDNDVDESEKKIYNSVSNIDEKQPVIVDRNLYNMYEVLKSHLNVGNVLPQDEYDKQTEEAENGEDEALEDVFNDGESHDRVIDPNNNSDHNFDGSDVSAVDY